MTDAELNVIMKSEGFKKVGDEIDGMTSKLNKLKDAFQFLTKLGETSRAIYDFGDKLANMTKELHTDKFISFNEELYKTGLVAGKTKDNINDFLKTMKEVRIATDASAESLVKLYHQMNMSAGFASMSESEMGDIVKKLYQAGISDDDAAKILNTMKNMTTNAPGMARAAFLEGDQGALQALQMQAQENQDQDALDALQMYANTGSNLGGNRFLKQAEQNKKAAQENKDLAIANAGAKFSASAIMFGAFLDKFMMKYARLIGGAEAISSIGSLGNDVWNAIEGAMSGNPLRMKPANNTAGGGGGEGGEGNNAASTLIMTLGAAGIAGAMSHWAGGAGANKPLGGSSKPGYNPAIDQAIRNTAQQQIDMLTVQVGLIDKTISLKRTGGALDREIQEFSIQKIPLLNQELELTGRQIETLKLHPLANKDMLEKYTSSFKEKQQQIIDLTKLLTTYYMTTKQVEITELNPKRISIIKSTTDDIGLQLKYQNQIKDTLNERIAGEKVAKQYAMDMAAAEGQSSQTIKGIAIQHEGIIKSLESEKAALELSLATMYAMTGGMKTTQFKWAQDALTAVSQLQTTLPTALGTLLQTRKGLYEMAVMERDTAHKGYLDAKDNHASALIIQTKQMDYLNKSNKAAQEFMALTGGLTDQIQMALGELHDVSGGFEDTAPKLAEQGMIVRRMIGDIYAPMFKYGGYGAEGAVGSEIFTKTFSSMSRGTSFGLGTAEGGIEKQLHVIVDNPEAIGDNIKPINIGRKS